MQPGVVRCFAILLATLLAASTAVADTDSSLIGDRPNADGPPDEIRVRFGLLDIDSIDDKNQLFSVDAYYELHWQDPRLAVEPGSDLVGRLRSLSPDDIWSPGLTVVNDRGLSRMLPDVAEVDSDGDVVIRQRVSGTLAVDLDLREFPFDTQLLPIDILSYKYSPSELKFSADSDFFANTSTFSADGWRFDIQPTERSTFQLEQTSTSRTVLTLLVAAERRAQFYVLTLALPLILVLFMAWAVHWLQPNIATRIGMSSATVFSLIALGVSLRLSLPQVGYLTLTDLFVIMSTLLVLVSMGTAVIATRLANEDRYDDAVRLTMYARRAFPLVFTVIVVSMMLMK